MQAAQKQNKKSRYPDVDPNPSFPTLEEEVLAFWQKEGIFEASVAARPAKDAKGHTNEFIFFDGPPFANGLPHYGHLLTGFVKDLIPRYQTMKGRRVERRFGWDCHGLPAEMGAEKELGISGRAAITNYGIGKFNDYCRSSVMKYAGEWEQYVTRQGRWVDFKNDYKTMNTSYMESVLWAFKQLYDKGLIYEAYRVMPYSWAAETPLSNFETRLDNSYRDREDKAVTVAFELNERPKGAPEAEKYYVLAWTTTPWTLPSNLALAVNEKIDYVGISDGNKCYFLAGSTISRLPPNLFGEQKPEQWEYTQPFKGKALIGLTYKPLFPYFKDQPKAFRILDGSEFVTDADGTGIVHMAPGFGEDDQRICEAAGIEIVCPVDGAGKFTDEIFDLLETPRCYLRPFTPNDFELFYELQASPEVAATTSDGVLPRDKIQAEFQRFLENQKEKGYSPWAVFEKSTGRFMGRAGLDDRDYSTWEIFKLPHESALKGSGENELAEAYHAGERMTEARATFHKEFWGNGYAKEVVGACVDWAFAHLPVARVVGGCLETSEASRRIMGGLGFVYHKTVTYKNQLVMYWSVTRDDYEKLRVAGKQSVGTYLKLNGLNVIADTRKDEREPYKKEQMEKYGLANLRIIDYLKRTGHLIKQEEIKHSYPHCWRTDQPLIYRAISSWYVEVTKFRDRMVELNQGINWIPEHVRDGLFGKWLEGARDWSISRNRFWGTPIPVWRSASGKIKVFGSIAELEKASGKKIPDLHRPLIDEIVITEGGEEYRRVEDVFDCWFESGSMPFAQVHYPFENKERFETHFPADFIVEYLAQTRGWFYTMVVLSTALFDKVPFKNCICHGVISDDKGQKLSKRLNNYVDPNELFNQYGADALRWFMLASPVMRGQELHIDKEGKFIRDVVRLAIKPIWNAYNFFCLYANADGIEARYSTESKDLMDRYILAKCRDAVEGAEKALDAYETVEATKAISDFFEVLNNWYIRRTKERFWKETQDEDKQSAYNTLYTVLVTMCRAAAPLLPFTTEAIYRGLTGEKSVHLSDWPDVEAFPQDEELMQSMDFVRDVCNVALSIRNNTKIRVRQPLSELGIVGGRIPDRRILDIILSEVNVRKYSKSSDEIEKYATRKLSLNNQVLGKRLPEKMKQIIPASKKGEWKQLPGGGVEILGEVLQEGEFTLQLEPKPEYKDRAQALSTNDALVILDTNITDELKAEGIARDVVRAVQEARKNAALHVSDRIRLSLEGPQEILAAVEKFRDYIAEQTLATSIAAGKNEKTDFVSEGEVEDGKITIGVSKA